jgi:hypothetical protein
MGLGPEKTLFLLLRRFMYGRPGTHPTGREGRVHKQAQKRSFFGIFFCF